MQDRGQHGRVDAAFGEQKRPQLRVAVLLDEKDAFVLGDEIRSRRGQRESRARAEIERDAVLGEELSRLAHRGARRAEIDHAKGVRDVAVSMIGDGTSVFAVSNLRNSRSMLST